MKNVMKIKLVPASGKPVILVIKERNSYIEEGEYSLEDIFSEMKELLCTIDHSGGKRLKEREALMIFARAQCLSAEGILIEYID